MFMNSRKLTSSEPQIIRSRSIDSQLGEASDRFFGEGFTRVKHRVKPTHASAELTKFDISSEYPDDWSRKGKQNQGAHLASVDAMVLSARMAEHHLRTAVDGIDVAACWISYCALEPGNEAVDVSRPLTASLDASANPARPGTSVTFRCQLSSFRVRMTVEIAFTDRDIEKSQNSRPGYYSEGYKHIDRKLCSATSAPGDSRIHSFFALSDPVTPSGYSGLESAHGSVVTFVDANILAAQLGQVYVYELDGIDRASSRTLWLRKAEFTRSHPPSGRQYEGVARVDLIKTLLIDRPTVCWRTATLQAHLGDVSVSYSLAHDISGSERQ